MVHQTDKYHPKPLPPDAYQAISNRRPDFHIDIIYRLYVYPITASKPSSVSLAYNVRPYIQVSARAKYLPPCPFTRI